MHNSKTLLAAAMAAVVSACGSPLQEFRDAAPSSQGIEVSLPRGSTQKQGLNDEQAKPALMPGVTLLSTVVVNGAVGLTLGVVASIIAEEPKVLTEDHAEWGPVTQPLWKHELQLKMDRVAKGHFKYVLERRLKGTTGSFEIVLTGEHHVTGLRSGNGQFVGHNLDDGTRAEVTYSRNDKKDLEVKVGFRGGVPSDYAFSQQDGGDGSFEFRVSADFVTRGPAKETLTVKSRWHQNGAGRADVTGSGGDLANDVRFTECWDTAFNRSYYNDTLSLFPTEGAASACTFSEASYASLSP